MPVASQAAITRAQLVVEAEPECATQTAVAARVRMRSRQIAFTPSARSRSLRAVVARTPDGKVRASLSVRDGDRRSERQLEAGSCEEAIDALALLIALALDPSASTPASPRESSSQAEAPPPRAATPSPGQPQRTPVEQQSPAKTPVADTAAAPPPEPPQAAETPPVAPSPRETPAPAEPAREEEPAADFVLAANVEGRGVFGPAPSLMPGVGLHLMLSWERSNIFSFALGLAALHSWRSNLKEEWGRAAFLLQLARLDVCVVRVRFGPAAVHGCGSGGFGRLRASGSDTYEPDSHSRLFAVVGGAVVMQLDVAGYLRLQAVANVGHALVRDSFAFRPDVFHRVSGVFIDLGFGAGVRFP